MERDLWKSIVNALSRAPQRWPRNGCYSNRQILAVFFWAALHDRPISWACRRCNWPSAAWRRDLPDQSTMSRRLRESALLGDIDDIRAQLQRTWPPGRRLLVDGKAMTLHDRTRDPDARTGWASGGYARGFKLHAIIDDQHALVAWDVFPMNHGESVVASELIKRLGGAATPHTMLGDAAYDSNPLHAACAARNVRLIAPRRRPGRGLGKRRHHVNRLRSIALLERAGGQSRRQFDRARRSIERFFSRLTVAGTGLGHLPAWVRGLRRVRLWVAAKLAINAARIERTRHELA